MYCREAAALLAVLCGCAARPPGGAMTREPFTEHYAGPGVAPGRGPSLTVAHGRAAWQRVVATLGAQHAAFADLPIDWSRSVALLLVGAPQGDAAHKLHLVSIVPGKDAIEVKADLQEVPGAASPDGSPGILSAVSVPAISLVVAEANASAFPPERAVRAVVGGIAYPASAVAHER
jgi:hypothetical protein